MNKIDLNKKYRTVSGDKVEVIKTDLAAPYTVLAVITRADGSRFGLVYVADGFINSRKGYHPDNLVEILPYEDFKIDEPVMVRDDDNGPWFRRHFAGVDHYGQHHGRAKTWDNGRTSWTAESDDVQYWSSWPQCRRPTPKELA